MWPSAARRRTDQREHGALVSGSLRHHGSSCRPRASRRRRRSNKQNMQAHSPILRPLPGIKTGIQEAASPSGRWGEEGGGGGAAGSDTGGGEGRAPTYIQTLLRSPCTACRAAVHRYAYKPPVNYFPDGGQKNSQSDSTSTVSTC